MSASKDESGRNDDLDWLYNRKPQPKETRFGDESDLHNQVDLDKSTPSACELPKSATPASSAAKTDAQFVTWSEDELPPRPVVSERPSPRATRPDAARRSPDLPPTRPVVDAPPRNKSAAKPSRKRPIRRVLAGIFLVVLAWLTFLIATPLHAWSQTASVDEVPAGKRPPDQPGTTFLLVGTDARDTLTETEKQRLGTGDTAGVRTDTMMVLFVPKSGRPALISLPRDSYVPIPGHGKDKLNAAYAFGGPKLLTQTVEQVTGLRIDGYVEIGLGGFANLVDAIDGIELCLNEPMVDHDSNVNLPAGCQTLTGAEALGFARMRKADPRGDLGRVERQRQVIAAIAKKAASPISVINPFRYWNLTHAITGNIRLSPDTGITAMLAAASGAAQFAKGKALSLTVPISNPNASTDVGSSVLWNTTSASELFAEITKGDTSKLDRFLPGK